ncbi:MAG: methyltransferase domain-containing protein [Shewanella sp.]|nr:methyltransferase domain-containing protein [Shewanella sp.]
MREAVKHFPVGDFVFDAEVAAIFDNMAIRSIPMYKEAHRLHAALLHGKFSKHSGVRRIIDIGTSTGSFLESLYEQFSAGVHTDTLPLILEGVDISKPMVKQAQVRCPYASIREGDLTDDGFNLPHNYYDAIACFYVLQFIEPRKRPELLAKFYQALRPGGMLILGQKNYPQILQEEKSIEYHRFRLSKGYTVEEVEAKSRALSKVMKPWSEDSLRGALLAAGFSGGNIEETTRWLQFSTLIAVKEV